MAYPPAPWSFGGYAVQTLQPMDSKRARQFVPTELQIAPVLPGRTLAGLYLASYGQGSVLQYNELIIFILTRHGRRLGFWITHIYVDHPASLAGGRELWGLPKELAQFSWEGGEQGSVRVRQGNHHLCSLHYGQRRWLWQQPVLLPVLSRLGADLLWFKGNLKANLGVAKGRVDVPSESPFAALGLEGSRRTFHYRDMRLLVHEPKVVASGFDAGFLEEAGQSASA